MPQKTSPYRIEDGRYKCPHEGCEHEPFNSLSALKYHMSNAHEGFTNEDVVQAVETAREADPETRTETTPAAPKRLSRKNRELNDKANEAIQLVLVHLTHGLDETSRARLDVLKGELTAAVSGVEFDFEGEKLVQISGRFWLIVLMLLLYLAPQLPTFGAVLKMMKQRKANGAKSDSGRDRTDRERQDDMGGDTLQ